jgi:hypothetical protein
MIDGWTDSKTDRETNKQTVGWKINKQISQKGRQTEIKTNE